MEEAWGRFFEDQVSLGLLPRPRGTLASQRHERGGFYQVSPRSIESDESTSRPPIRRLTPDELEAAATRSRLAERRENLGHLFVFVCGGRDTEGPFDTEEKARAVQRGYPPGTTRVIDLRSRPLRRPWG